MNELPKRSKQSVSHGNFTIFAIFLFLNIRNNFSSRIHQQTNKFPDAILENLTAKAFLYENCVQDVAQETTRQTIGIYL